MSDPVAREPDATDVPLCIIEEVVGRAYQRSRGDILSYRRDDRSVEARHVVAWMAFKLTTLSYPLIGAQMARDHTSIIYAVRSIEERVAAEPDFAASLDRLMLDVLALVNSPGAVVLLEIDAATAASKVAAAGPRAAIALSTLEVVAVCVRAANLEEVAGGAFQLLSRIDELAALRPAYSVEDRVRLDTLQPAIAALTATLSSALAALGYVPEEPTEEGHNERTAEPEPANV